MKATTLQRLTGLALYPYRTPPNVKKRDGAPVFAVESIRESRRERGDGRVLNQVFITLLQTEKWVHEGIEHAVRCGSVLVLDLDDLRVTYVVRKGLHDRERLLRTIQFQENLASASLYATYLGAQNEPFAALHSTGA